VPNSIGVAGIGVSVGAMCPIRPNVVWAMDFQFDETSDGRTLKLLNVIDEYTRESLAMVVERSIECRWRSRLPRDLAAVRGAPAYVRFDNGPEFSAYALADWCRFNGTESVFIDPGSPWQNAWIESFNGRLRDEHLNGQRFAPLLEAKVFTEDWRIDYKINRPHSAHGWLTVDFVESWLNQQQLTLA
jgi:transposase InsO family protein